MKLHLSRFKPSVRMTVLGCLIVTITASLFVQQNRNRYLAAKHHFDTVRFGYMAVRAQRPADADWNRGWRAQWTWPSGMKMDRQSIWAVLPMWDQSLRSAQLRDHYAHISANPWLMFSREPASRPPLSIPLDDARFSSWWAENLKDHVVQNGLNDSWGTSYNTEMLERQCGFMNDSRDLPWYSLRELMPVEDGYEDEAEEFQLALHSK